MWKFLYKMERAVGKLAIRNLMTILTGAIVMVFLADKFVMYSISEHTLYELMSFDRAAILRGEIWRLIFFIFLYPSTSNILFTLLAMYLYWWIGSILERRLGSDRFNTYYLIGILGTIAGGFVSGYATNLFLNLSLYFALAMLYPNVQLLLFFIIPVKLKWLATIQAVIYVYIFVMNIFLGQWHESMAIVFSLINFFVYFGLTLINVIKREWKNRRK